MHDDVGQRALTKSLAEMVLNLHFFMVEVCVKFIIRKNEDIRSLINVVIIKLLVMHLLTAAMHPSISG